MTRGWWPSRRLRRLPELEILTLGGNPIGDEGLAALVAPPPPAGAPPPTGGLTKLKRLYQLYVGNTQVTDAGCATLAAAFSSGVLPALKVLDLEGIPASAAAMVSVRQAQARSDFCESRRVSLEGVVERGGRSRVWTSSD